MYTVKDLIEILNQCPEDYKIMLQAPIEKPLETFAINLQEKAVSSWDNKKEIFMELREVLFNIFIVAFLLFVLLTSILGKFMGDKETLITSALVALACGLLSVFCPEDMQESAMTTFVGIFLVAGLLQFFKK